ncbi:MAG: hypothetical protein ACYTE5_11095, partial [Planctomycetota bacterium]
MFRRNREHPCAFQGFDLDAVCLIVESSDPGVHTAARIRVDHDSLHRNMAAIDELNHAMMPGFGQVRPIEPECRSIAEDTKRSVR